MFQSKKPKSSRGVRHSRKFRLHTDFSGVSWGVHSVRLHPGGSKRGAKKEGRNRKKQGKGEKRGKKRGAKEGEKGRERKYAKEKERGKESKENRI